MGQYELIKKLVRILNIPGLVYDEQNYNEKWLQYKYGKTKNIIRTNFNVDGTLGTFGAIKECFADEQEWYNLYNNKECAKNSNIYAKIDEHHLGYKVYGRQEYFNKLIDCILTYADKILKGEI